MKRILIVLVWGLTSLTGTALAATDFSKVDAKSGYFSTSDGVRLHYLEAGKGDPIVFVPGWTVPAWSWEPQIRHFAKTNHVVALDPRSQGESERPTEGHYPERRAKDIKELIEAKHLGRAVVVGHSLAVTEELAYVEQFGTGSLAGLVFIDQGFGPYEADPQMIGIIRACGGNRRAFLDQLGGWFFKKPTPPGYQKQLFDACMKTPANTAVALLASRFGMDFRPAVAKLDIPVLFVAQPQFRETGEWLKKNLSSARVEVFEDAGHCLFIDDADRFNALLDEFARDAFRARGTRPDKS
jgi:non-heme chloroperoxidase